jgi:hypothetical protein
MLEGDQVGKKAGKKAGQKAGKKAKKKGGDNRSWGFALVAEHGRVMRSSAKPLG